MDNNRLSDVAFFQLSAYTAPAITEAKKGAYVEYGDDNNYFQYLIDKYLYSPTNSSIITGIANMIYGKGLIALDAAKKPNEYARFISIVKQEGIKKAALERKMLGMAALQVIKKDGAVTLVDHFPMHTLRPEKCNEKGEIEAYYYMYDWSKKKPSEQPKRIPAFGFGNGNEAEIYVIKPYVSGYHYFSPIDYSGALPYCVLEEEIADYLINDVKNGFSGTKIINFNNGVPPEEKRDEIKRDVLSKTTGSRGDKVIVSFNQNSESKTTIDDVSLNDAPSHYEYLAKECFEKLIVGHRVTSPMLLGIRDTGGGLSNNTDEIETSTLLFLNLVIKPYQQEIIQALDTILAVNEIALDLKFERLQPLDNDTMIEENEVINALTSMSPLVATKVLDSMTPNEIRALIKLPAKAEGTSIEMSKQDNLDELADDFTNLGEDIQDNWILIDENDVDVEIEGELDTLIEDLNKRENKETILSKIFKFVSTGTARPNSTSEQDKKIDGARFITRYRYDGGLSSNSRDFCRKMVGANKVYRKEDIEQMSMKVVNAGFGVGGSNTYDIFLYKGGARCKHKWTRMTLFNTEGLGIDVNNPNAQTISTNKAESMGYRVRNPKEVAMKPEDMTYEGYTEEYYKKRFEK